MARSRVWGGKRETREGKEGLACFATNPNRIASVVQARNYCQLQLLPLTRFECFRTATNCGKFALKSASHCCDNEHDKRELNIFLISEFGGSCQLREGVTDRSCWFVCFFFLLHTTDRTQRASRVCKMPLFFQWMSSILSSARASRLLLTTAPLFAKMSALVRWTWYRTCTQ